MFRNCAIVSRRSVATGAFVVASHAKLTGVGVTPVEPPAPGPPLLPVPVPTALPAPATPGPPLLPVPAGLPAPAAPLPVLPAFGADRPRTTAAGQDQREVWPTGAHPAEYDPRPLANGPGYERDMRRRPTTAQAGGITTRRPRRSRPEHAVPEVRGERAVADRQLLQPDAVRQRVEQPHAAADQVGREVDDDLVAQPGRQRLLPG